MKAVQFEQATSPKQTARANKTSNRRCIDRETEHAIYTTMINEYLPCKPIANYELPSCTVLSLAKTVVHNLLAVNMNEMVISEASRAIFKTKEIVDTPHRINTVIYTDGNKSIPVALYGKYSTAHHHFVPEKAVAYTKEIATYDWLKGRRVT